MPNWKKLIVSGSDATLNSLNVTTTGSFGGIITIPDYIVHAGDADTKIGFSTDNNVEIRAGGNLQISADASRSYLRFQGTSKLRTDSTGVLVDGAAKFTTNVSFDSSESGRIYKASNHGLAIHGVAGSENNFAIFTPAGQLKIVNPSGSNDLVLNRDSGNVGIGLAEPSTVLHVTGSEVRFEGATQSTLNLRTTTNTKNNYIVGTSAGDIAIRANSNNNALVVKANQDISVGNNISASGDDILIGGGETLIRTYSGYLGLFAAGGSAKDLKAKSLTLTNDFNDSAPTNGLFVKGNAVFSGSVTSSNEIVASGSKFRAINDAADSVGLTLESPLAGVNVNFDFEVGDTGISDLHAKNLVIRGSSGASDIAFSPSTAYPGLMMLDGSAGRVGIGTTSPSYALDVVGKIQASDRVISNQYQARTTFGMVFKNSGGSDKLFISNDGNVGINNTSPSKRLVVNGQTQFYEYSGAHLTNNAISNYNFDTLVTNASATAGGSLNAYVKLAAGATNNSLGDFNAIRTRAYAENTTVNVGGLINFYAEYRNFTSTNSVTLSNHYGLKVDTLGVGGNATVTNNYGVYLNPGTTASNNYGVFQVGSAVKNRFAGKVGIGDDPDRALHVKDSSIVVAKFQGQSSAGHLIDLVHDHSNDGYNGLRFFDQTTGRMHITHIQTGTKGYIQVGNNWASGSEILVVEGDNERVGIGTKSPSAQLHATGNTLIGGYLRVQDASSNHAIQINSSTSGNARILAHNLNLNQDHNLDIEAKEIDLQAGSTSGGTLASVLKLTSASATFAGDVNVGGKLTAQEFHTEFVSASIIYDSGSTKFGDTPDDVHDFTGSINIHSGSFTLKPLFQSTTGLFKIIHGPATSSTIQHIKIENTGSQELFVTQTDVNGHTEVRLSNNGTERVRIGTYWPTYINNGGYSTRGGLLVGTGSYTDNYYGLAVAEGGSSGSLNVADTLYVSGSRVGVKTTAPEDELEVFGDFRIRNSNGNNPADAGNLFFAETEGTFGSDAYGFRIHQDGSNNRLHFQGGAAASTVDNILVLERDTGDVGINIANPTEKLEVAGNIMAKDSGVLAGVNGDKDGFIFHDLYTGGGNYYGYKAFTGGNTRLSIVTDGSERLTVLAGGNVGIGITTPNEKLHVEGTSRFGGDMHFGSAVQGLVYRPVESSSAIDRFFLMFDETNNASFPFLTNRTPNGAVVIKTGTAAGSAENEHFRIKGGDGIVDAYFTNANLGIGTTTPGRTLHLYHATENEVLRLESGDGGAYVQFKDNNSDFQPAVGAVGNNLQFRASGSQIAKFDINGNLRLGSDTGIVRARLHLSGSTAAKSGIRQSRSGSKIWSQEIDNNGKLQWAYRSTEAGSATQHFTLNDTGQAILHQYGSGNYTGTAAKTLAVDSSGNIIETDGGGAGTVDGNGVAAQLTFWQDTDTITGSSDTNTNVNVGRLKIGSYVNDYIYLSHYDYGTSTNYALNQGPTGGTSVNAPTGQSVALKINNSAKLTVSSAGNVGIGTTSPDEKVHIEGNNNGNVKLLIENTSTGSSAYTTLGFQSNQNHSVQPALFLNGSNNTNYAGANSLNMYQHGSFPLGFVTNNQIRMTVTGGGNVGIGTTTPGHKLTVIGGNIQTNGIVYSNTVRDNTGGNVVIQDNGGNVGIGTTSPDNSLEIFKEQDGDFYGLKIAKLHSNTNQYTAEYANNQIKFSGNQNFMLFNDTSKVADFHNSKVTFHTNGGNERMRIDSDGTVGIGTTSMDSLLHISSSTFNNHITLARDSAKLGITVSGNQILLEGGVTPFSNDTSDLGRSDKHWRSLYITDNIYVSASGDLNLTGSLKISSNLTVANNTTTNLLYTDNIQTRNGTVIDFRHQDASVIMRVDTDDAKVGIGSTSTGAPSPTYKLDVQGSTSNTNVRVLTTTGNANYRLQTNNSHFVLTGVGAANQFTIYDSNASAVRQTIESTGKIRFNSYGSATHTGTPAKTLQVDSNGNIIEGAIVNFAPKVEYQALSSDIAANATFTLPNSLSYTVSSGGYEYLEIFLDGIRLMRGIDFEEISTTQVKILMAVPSGSVFTYKSIT